MGMGFTREPLNCSWGKKNGQEGKCKYLQSTLWEPARNCSRKIVVIVTFVGHFTGEVQRNCNCGSKLLKLKVILLQLTIHHRVIVLWERCTYISTPSPRAALEDQTTRRLYLLLDTEDRFLSKPVIYKVKLGLIKLMREDAMGWDGRTWVIKSLVTFRRCYLFASTCPCHRSGCEPG